VSRPSEAAYLRVDFLDFLDFLDLLDGLDLLRLVDRLERFADFDFLSAARLSGGGPEA
jgi:hypothetical protein